jgi:Na+/melibiose symporter-like transporter
MIPDTIEFAQSKFGYRADGMISSTASFFQKLAKTVGGAGVALVLGLSGYVANEEQSASALSAIHSILTLAPIPILFILIFLTLIYRLDQKTHGQIVEELSASPSDSN